jgi:predicted acylesterase/phospholipase RssA
MSTDASASEQARREVLRDASASEQALRNRIRDGGFAIALSGGGHRATLATVGALIAIVDRGLGPKVIQVASVSGGSITNAFVAQRCRLNEKTAPGELDDIAAELATTIIRKGVLTKGWIAVLLFTSVALGVVAGIVLRTLVLLWTWLATVIGVVVGLAALLLCGLVVEWLIDRRYFQYGTSAGSWGHRKRARFASLSGTPVDHVICMTDFALGLPVYASSQHGGLIWRRLKPERPPGSEYHEFHTFDASGLSIAELVRASAAFPGIPPRRLRIPPDPQIELVAESPKLALLADGGLWNNLGSQVLREDEFIGSHAAWDNGVLRPYGPTPKDMPLLCVNGSAPLRPTKAWAFRIPGIALLNSLLQTTEILNTNTVLPRVDAMRRAFIRRVRTGKRPDYLDPADLVVDLSAIDDTADAYRAGSWLKENIRETDPAVKEYERNALSRLDIARKFATTEPGRDWLAFVLGTEREPEGSYPVCSLANIDDWDALQTAPAWKQLVEKEGTGRVDASTTLGRIESTLARRLIARGYLNTYLVSLFLKPLADGEIDQLARLSRRLDNIVAG